MLASKFYTTFIFEDRYLYFLNGLKITLILTLASFILGTLLGIAFCFLKQSKNKTVRKTVNMIGDFFVQIPTMVLLMIFAYIIFGTSGLNILIVVIIALTIKAASYLAEIFNSAVETVNRGEIEAARTLGMTKKQTFFNITLPQSIDAALPLFKNQFIVTLQETSIVGYLAIMDLTRASTIVTARTLDAFFGLIVISVMYMLIGSLGKKLLGLFGNRKHLGESQ